MTVGELREAMTRYPDTAHVSVFYKPNPEYEKYRNDLHSLSAEPPYICYMAFGEPTDTTNMVRIN